MARSPRIRIKDNDKAEYARLVKNTKAKIARTKKKYGVDLTAEIDIPELDSFETRAQFNKWKEQASSFTNRANMRYQFEKNAYGVVASKAKIAEIERNTKEVQRLVDEKIKAMKDKEYYAGGKPQGTIEQRIAMTSPAHVTGINRPHDFDFSKVRTYSRLRTLEESMEMRTDPQYYEKKMIQLQLNFIKSVEGSFNSFDAADELIEELKKIPPDDFYELFLRISEISFEEFDSEGNTVENVEGNVYKILSYLEQYRRGDFDLSLKGF
ncbi:putative terminal protein [Bacillus phage BSP2]|uniref:Late genes activator p4 n=1 Tax=Bacillus phage BSTP4 TaxID=2801529 RepID=A0A7T8EP15_9CAUD|nr:putative terminal protein [Bacillus phage BSP4]AYJ76482.1 putative terminal protein [Bacillus phage BSP2]QQO90037.1 late genes activator p4 [Bacillus phage BSTP4]